MNYDVKNMLALVRGNDVLLDVFLYEWVDAATRQPFNLDLSDDVQVHLTNYYGRRYEIAALPLDGHSNGLACDILGTYPCGTYSLEITLVRGGRHVRSFESPMFRIVERNADANMTFDIVSGGRRADTEIEMQVVAQAVARGKNAYELAVEQGYEGTLGDWLADIVHDADYVHTDNNFTDEYKQKVDDGMNVPEWALQPTKPTYTPEEVGAPSTQEFEDAVQDLEREKQDALVSGENIKTVNGKSLVGSGNVTIPTGLTTAYEVVDAGMLYLDQTETYYEVPATVYTALKAVWNAGKVPVLTGSLNNHTTSFALIPTYLTDSFLCVWHGTNTMQGGIRWHLSGSISSTGGQLYPEEEQKPITIDQTVQAGSTNPVSSAGVKTYVDGVVNMVPVTYSELVTLKNTSQLVEGRFYRITDFVTTVVRSNARSAGHPFDIIVRADSKNVINENALATHHAGDTYFANNRLSAWELKYDINNDTAKYDWADSTNGKGVIYWLKDEKGNECAYDFKNIQFMVGAKTSAGTVAGVYYFTYSAVSGNGDSTVTDLSLYSGCTNNRIDVYLSGTKQMLNANVFRNTSQSAQCNNMSFGPNCFNNTFGNFNSKIIMRGYCANNEFGAYNSNSQFGDGCSNNVFGNYGGNIVLGNACSNNVFGNYANNCNFGNACSYNKFGQNCVFIQFSNQCTYNTFGNYAQYITFNNYCGHIQFGSLNAVKNYYRYINVEAGNQYIYLDCAETTSTSKYCQNVQICLGANNTTTYRSIIISTAGNTFRSVYDRDYYTEDEVNALIPTESTVSKWGFTKNVGTITGITMNGASKGTSGVVDLGTVITSHQDISGKENTSNKVTSLSGSSTDAQYPSAKVVYDVVGDINEVLDVINGEVI